MVLRDSEVSLVKEESLAFQEKMGLPVPQERGVLLEKMDLLAHMDNLVLLGLLDQL